MQGALTLTIVVGAYFLAEGVATIMYALEHRKELSQRWSWLLVAGIMDILIAAIIIAGLPGSALLGHRAAGRGQYAVRRRDPDRSGARGPQRLMRLRFDCNVAIPDSASREVYGDPREENASYVVPRF